MAAPVYRANVTDKQQNDVETADFEGGVPVFVEGETREVVRELGGTEKVAHATTNLVQPDVTIGKNAGVSMPWDDTPGRFSDHVGKP